MEKYLGVFHMQIFADFYEIQKIKSENHIWAKTDRKNIYAWQFAGSGETVNRSHAYGLNQYLWIDQFETI